METDRPHVFNAYGAYIFNWLGSKTNSTEFSAIQTITSGIPQTTRIYVLSNITPTIFTKRGDLGRGLTFTQTDLNITHRYRFGKDNRFTLAGDLNFLNLFNQDTVTGVFTTLSQPSAQISGGILGFPNNGVEFTNAYTSGVLLTPINNYLNGTPTILNRKDARYGQPNAFQAPRSVRFGFRLLF